MANTKTVDWNIKSVWSTKTGQAIDVLIIDDILVDWTFPETGQTTLLKHLLKLHPELKDEVYV